MLNVKNAPFLQDKGANAVYNALNNYKKNCVRFVGGVVRDAILERKTSDIDMATSLLPNETTKALEIAGIRYVPTGIEHGTISAIYNKKPYEITTLRKDVETDGRHAEVAFTDDWIEDAKRRDFSLNALYCDIEGNIFDPLGGIDDCLKHRIIFVGNAHERIKEDYLRILRFFRFFAYFGNEIDEEGFLACCELASHIKSLSKERVRAEIIKIFLAPKPLKALQLMEKCGILKIIFSEYLPLELLEKHILINGLVIDYLSRIMAIIPKNENYILELAKNLRLSNDEKKRLINWSRFESEINKENIESQIFFNSNQIIIDNLITQNLENSKADFDELLNIAKNFKPKTFEINGNNLIALGLNGKRLGADLLRLKEIWAKSGFKTSKVELLEIAKGFVSEQ